MPDRVLPFDPQPGKLGFVTINGVRLNVASFEPKGSGEAVDATNFNSPFWTSPVNILTIHSEKISPSVADHEFVVRGPRDGPGSAIAFNPMVGDFGTATLFYSGAFGWSFDFAVTAVGGGQTVRGIGMVEFTIVSTGLVTFLGVIGGN